MRKHLLFVPVSLILTLGACSSGAAPTSAFPTSTAPAGSTAASANAVHVKLFAFSPKELTVAVGTNVMWDNQDEILHTITSGVPDAADAGSEFDGTLPEVRKTFSHTFDKAGTYKYFCRRHSTAMFGTVTVS